MGVKARNLVNLGLRQFEFFGECGHVPCCKMTKLILNEMQILDQMVAAALAITQQRQYFGACARIDLASFGGKARPRDDVCRGDC